MEPKDIIVGKRYVSKHLDEDVICLGVGMRELYTGKRFKNVDKFIEKHLVIVSSDDSNDIGLMIQEGENAIDGLWDSIKQID